MLQLLELKNKFFLQQVLLNLQTMEYTKRIIVALWSCRESNIFPNKLKNGFFATFFPAQAHERKSGWISPAGFPFTFEFSAIRLAVGDILQAF